jgi:hypothetical protein
MRKTPELTFGKTPAKQPRRNGHTVIGLVTYKSEEL